MLRPTESFPPEELSKLS